MSLKNAIVGLASAGALLAGFVVGSPVASQAAISAKPQAEIDAYLKQHPDGEQVSDNAVSFKGGSAIVVFPNPGVQRAPDGLGPNPRKNAPQFDPSVNVSSSNPAESARVLATAYQRGCPYSTLTDADWYCFYTGTSWTGRRLQFKDSYSGLPSDYGFDNQTQSWVNTNHTFSVYAWDTFCSNTFPLWTEPSGPAESSDVGSTKRNKMSYWNKGGYC